MTIYNSSFGVRGDGAPLNMTNVGCAARTMISPKRELQNNELLPNLCRECRRDQSSGSTKT